MLTSSYDALVLPESLPDTAGTIQISSNDHHCVSRAFLGSYASVNITRMDAVGHSQFHRIMGYSTPDFMMRNICLSSINWHEKDGRKIPFDWYKKVLGFLSPSDWRSLYLDETFRNPHEVGNETLLQSAVHIRLHLLEEQQKTNDAIRAVLMAEYLKRPTVEYSMNAMLLFGNAPRPVETVYHFLTEANESGDRKWTRPMKPADFNQLRGLTRNCESQEVDISYPEKLMRLLDEHSARLNKWMHSWQIHGTGDASKLAEYAETRRRRKMGDVHNC